MHRHGLRFMIIFFVIIILYHSLMHDRQMPISIFAITRWGIRKYSVTRNKIFSNKRTLTLSVATAVGSPRPLVQESKVCLKTTPWLLRLDARSFVSGLFFLGVVSST